MLFSDWVGRTDTHRDTIAAAPLRGLAAVLDREASWGDAAPALAHWLYFLPAALQRELGRDGHPMRGGFLPPVELPRRMWAGGRLQFHAPLPIGANAERVSTIRSTTPKTGASGDMVFVTVAHEVRAEGRAVITARRPAWTEPAAGGVRLGATELIALVESAAGLHNATAIAAVPSITGIALGTEDLCVGLGVASASSLDLPCKQIALAAATRGLMALGAPVSISEFRDIAAYSAGLGEARRIGMNGVFCIHPAQVEAANAWFALTESELAEARDVLAAWAVARQKGLSVVSHNGRMIDAPVVARAKRLVERS